MIKIKNYKSQNNAKLRLKVLKIINESNLKVVFLEYNLNFKKKKPLKGRKKQADLIFFKYQNHNLVYLSV